MPGNDPRASNHSVVAELGIRLAQATQSASRRVSLGKFRTTAHMAGPRRSPVADRSSQDGEAGTCRCDPSWPRKANWVKITPSAPAISNCSQELSRRINPVTAPATRSANQRRAIGPPHAALHPCSSGRSSIKRLPERFRGPMHEEPFAALVAKHVGGVQASHGRPMAPLPVDVRLRCPTAGSALLR